MSTVHRAEKVSGTRRPDRDLLLAWVAMGFTVGLVALMPMVPSVAETWGADIEGAPFLSALAYLAGFVLVVDTFAVAAIVLGGRATRAGRRSGRVPQVVSAVAGGFITVLMLLAGVAHLLGME